MNKKIAAGVVLFVLILGGGLFWASRARNKPVAIVNGTPITDSQVEAQLTSIKKRQPNAFQGPQGKALEASYRKAIKQQLIIQELMNQEAAKRGIKVDEREVEIAIAQVRQAYQSDKKFNDSLAAIGKTLDQYKQDIRNSLIRNQLMAEIVKGVSVTDSEAKQYYDANPYLFKDKGHSFKAVKEQIKQQLLAQKQRNKINNFVEQLKKKANLK